MTEQPKDDEKTELEELNDDGIGGTLGEDSTFNVEEDDKAAEERDDV